MSFYDWSMNKMAGWAKNDDVIMLQATTTSGLSSETQKYMRKGYVMQGNITSDFDRTRRCTVYYATMIKASISSASVAAPSIPVSSNEESKKKESTDDKELFQLREQLNEWLKNHPEENDFIGRLTAFEFEYSNTISSKKKALASREFVNKQLSLREEALKKIPLYIKLYSCLLENIEIDQDEEDINEDNAALDDASIDYKSLSKKELKSYISLQKSKLSTIKDFYRNKINSLDTKVRAIDMKNSFTFGMSAKTSSKLEKTKNDLLQTKKEALLKINEAKSLLEEMKEEYKNRKD